MYNKSSVKSTKYIYLIQKKLNLLTNNIKRIEQNYIIYKLLQIKNLFFIKFVLYYFYILLIKQINFIYYFKFFKFNYQLIFIILFTFFFYGKINFFFLNKKLLN